MDIVGRVEEIVKNDISAYAEKAEDHYDFWREHIQYVYKEAILLAKKYHADEEVVRLGALLHDIALIRSVGTKADHHVNGAEIAEKVLTDLVYPEEKMKKVIRCVYNHRSSKNATSLEELCVADADILAHFDNISMLYYMAFTKNKIPLSEAKDWMRNALSRDFNDLSEHTKKEFKGQYQMICKTIIGD